MPGPFVYFLTGYAAPVTLLCCKRTVTFENSRRIARWCGHRNRRCKTDFKVVCFSRELPDWTSGQSLLLWLLCRARSSYIVFWFLQCDRLVWRGEDGHFILKWGRIKYSTNLTSGKSPYFAYELVGNLMSKSLGLSRSVASLLFAVVVGGFL